MILQIQLRLLSVLAIYILYIKQELSKDTKAYRSRALSSYDMANGQKPFNQLTLGYGVHNLKLCYDMIMEGFCPVVAEI